jgi:hypothetical protein
MNVLPLPAERIAEPAEEMARYVVGAAMWAPSVHDTQPWWFTANGPEISLHADADRQLIVADPGGREMIISCGAALFTTRLALRSLGYMRTHRGGFDPRPLAPELLAALQEGAEQDGAMLRILTGEGNRAALAVAVETAECALMPDSAHARELARWASPPGSTRRDGVPPTVYPVRPERTLPHFPSRDFAHGRSWGCPPFSSAVAPRSAGVVCLLTTTGDRPVDWVNAGQALQRVLLTSATCGVAAALRNHPFELAWLCTFIPGGPHLGVSHE